MLKILIVDDHFLFAEGMRCILERLGDKVIVFDACCASDGLTLAAQHNDLTAVLLDLYLPDVNGIEALSQFKQAFPALPVIILSACENAADMRSTLDLGASGFIHKASKTKVMLHAIRLVLDGGVYVPPQMLNGKRPNNGGDNPIHTSVFNLDKANNNAQSLSQLGLTPRQTQVLRYIVRGLSNKQIGHVLAITEATAKAHVTAILKTLNVSNRTKAAQVVNELRIQFPEGN